MRRNFQTVSLITAALIATAGCSAHREFRVASVGSNGSFEVAGDDDGTGSPANAPAGKSSAPIVTSGSPLLAGGSATGGIVNGTVTGLLGSTGHTLVKLANGTSLLLNGTGGSLGDMVSIDVGAARVVGGPTGLLGVNVAGVSAGTQLSIGTGTGSSGILSPSAGLSVGPSATGNVTGTVTNTVTGVTGGVLGTSCC